MRVQQVLGPIYDLGFERVDLTALSDIVNHKPRKKEIATTADGVTFVKNFDENGIRLDKHKPGSDHAEAIRILFMGDSFMEGYDDENTIPHQAWKAVGGMITGREIKMFNGGHSSYSPAIFIPQAKHLMPIVKPDFVVVDIDETDLGDDFIRYKDLIYRDAEGRILGVSRTPLNDFFLRGLLQIKSQPLYIFRLFQKWYHTRIVMPKAEKEYWKKDPRYTLIFAEDERPDAKQRYAKEIDFFESNLDELAQTLIQGVGDAKRVLFIHHPHLQHLKRDRQGRRFNQLVRDSVQKIAAKHQINFYDATEDLKRVFGDNPENFYWPKDMHFSSEGIKMYGRFVGIKLSEIMSAMAPGPVIDSDELHGRPD